MATKDEQKPREERRAGVEPVEISRRSLLMSASAAAATAILPSFLQASVTGAAAASNARAFVYVGNFTSKPTNWDTPQSTSRGFGIYRYDQASGDLELIQANVMNRVSVGATCIDHKRNVLYCTHEFMTQPGYYKGGGGLVYALAINPQTGDLTELNHQPSYGSLPSYPAIDVTGKYLIVVTYTGGTPITKAVKDPSGKYRIVVEYDQAVTVLYRLNPDGSIGDPCDMYMHSGSGPGEEQTHARIHSVMRSPSGNFFVVCDWGSDKIYSFRINQKTEKLEVCGQPYESIPGSKPRYSAFHPTLPYVFVNHEGKTVISVFRYEENGTLHFLQAADVLPSDAKIDATVAQSDIRIHPSGKHLYTVIRGLNVVSVFTINEKTGAIERIQTYSLEGGGPRGCAVSPDGRFLHVALTSIQKVSVLAIGEDGKVSSTGKILTQPNPGNVTFFVA